MYFPAITRDRSMSELKASSLFRASLICFLSSRISFKSFSFSSACLIVGTIFRSKSLRWTRRRSSGYESRPFSMTARAALTSPDAWASRDPERIRSTALSLCRSRIVRRRFDAAPLTGSSSIAWLTSFSESFGSLSSSAEACLSSVSTRTAWIKALRSSNRCACHSPSRPPFRSPCVHNV